VAAAPGGAAGRRTGGPCSTGGHDDGAGVAAAPAPVGGRAGGALQHDYYQHPPGAAPADRGGGLSHGAVGSPGRRSVNISFVVLHVIMC
jgi:hypothetical protein